MRIAWATDIHLDCVQRAVEAVDKLYNESLGSDCLILTGDISVSPFLISHLQLLDDTLRKPIYFVLGNHDYYFSNIGVTRKKIANACRHMSFARYLGDVSFIRLNKSVCLVGADGWYDALNGNPFAGQFLMNDWVKIENFMPSIRTFPTSKAIDRRIVAQISQNLSRESAAHIARGIKSCINGAEHVIIATHVPPFAQACLSSKYPIEDVDEISPWYSSRIMSEVILSAARAYPSKNFTVLSGHTHGHFNSKILPNLTARVGKSEYGLPQIADLIDI